MNVLDFIRYKQSGRKISMVTCYDYWSACIINRSSLDTILVGDSLSMVMHGHPTTVHATLEVMALHTAAVVRGAPDKFIVGDLPFLSYRKGLVEAMNAIHTLMQAGCHAVKLEGLAGNETVIEHAVDSGIPMIVHLGMTPQAIHSLGGFRVQSKTREEADRLLLQAKESQDLGATAVVLECVPPDAAKAVSDALDIPTIGIGAGPHVDGQVLVLQDLLGMDPGFKPRFLRRYLDGFEILKGALDRYHQDVVNQQFPTEEESYACLAASCASSDA